MFCSNCGGAHAPHAVICPKCGAGIAASGGGFGQPPLGNPNVKQVSANDTGGCLWVFLGWLMGTFASFILPLVLFIVWKDEYPKRAQATLIGMVISIFTDVLIVIGFILIMIAVMSASYYW